MVKECESCMKGKKVLKLRKLKGEESRVYTIQMLWKLQMMKIMLRSVKNKKEHNGFKDGRKIGV